MRLRFWDTLHCCADGVHRSGGASRWLTAVLFAVSSASVALAGDPLGSSPAGTAPGIPPQLQGVGITDKLGAKVPLDSILLVDEEGRERPLRSFIRKDRPVLLNIVYYTCPSLCGLVLNATLDGLKGLDWSAGQQFDVVTVSMDHREGFALAKSKKEAFLKSYGRESAAAGWHFLTGKEDQIRKLADAVGFGFKWDEKQGEYAHGAGVFVLTPEGTLSRTLYGIQYPARDLRLALLEAGQGKIGTLIDRVVLFCFRYDPTQRGYAIYAFRFVQAGSAGTVFVLGGYLLVYWRRQRRLDERSNQGSAA